MTDPISPYPGDKAQPEDLLALAQEYHRAANALLALGKKGKPLSRAPWRLTAIHAIELYLNALLLNAGATPLEVRGLQHDLAVRRDKVTRAGITLRARTSSHLEALTSQREYLATRYATDHDRTLSQINRIQATLDELAVKATEALRKNCPNTVSPGAYD